jgi:hypothetical protein
MKLSLNDILKVGGKLKSFKIPDNAETAKMIDDVKKKQAAILKLKEVSRESLDLRMTI